MIRKLLVLFVLCFLVVGAYLAYQYHAMQDWLITPLASKDAPKVIVTIPKGTSQRAVLHILAKNKLISDSPFIGWVGKFGFELPAVQAGEFELSADLSPLELMQQMEKGVEPSVRLTLPEGLTAANIVSELEAMGWGTKQSIFYWTSNKSFLTSLGVPADYIEGFLFPDTYFVPRSYTPDKIFKLMVENFFKHFTPDLQQKAQNMGLSLYQVVTIASIIQLESGSPKEYPLISAVIRNRLKLGMRLQMDPTVIYGMPNNTERVDITRKDLETDHPWNTYTRAGLPPTPISNPGFDALKAAVDPAPVDYLYFVAMNNGYHKFSSNLEDHNAAVKKYQILKVVEPLPTE